MRIHQFARGGGRTLGAALVALSLSSVPAVAQNNPLLVDTEWLSQHLKDRGLVVLHVGGAGDYAAGHIPGSVPINQDDVARPRDPGNPGELTLELPTAESLRQKLASLGISDGSRIIVYAGRGTVLQAATRIIFTLDYLGLGDRTSLLNGGLAKWVTSGKALTAEATAVAKGTLTAKPTRSVVADAAFVKSLPQRPNHVLVDARAPVFYKGIDPTMNDKAGHIPGAVNIPFSQIGDTEQMIDRERVAASFREAGVKAGDTIVAYCHIGQQATAVVFGARLLGHPVLLYDGSFQDWAINNRGPVVK